jgi:hypothetical protein
MANREQHNTQKIPLKDPRWSRLTQKLSSTYRQGLEAYENLARGHGKRKRRKECKEDNSFTLPPPGSKMPSYSIRTRAYIMVSTPKRSTIRRTRPLTFNSITSFMVGLFSGVLARSMRLVSVRG